MLFGFGNLVNERDLSVSGQKNWSWKLKIFWTRGYQKGPLFSLYSVGGQVNFSDRRWYRRWCTILDVSSGESDAHDFDPEEARAIAWFLTGLRREASRLAKKYRQLDEHELLILNCPVPQSADSDELTMIDAIPAAVDVPGEAEGMVFIQKALSLLTPQEQRVVKAAILDGFTERKAAKELRVSQPVVHRVKERVLNKLRKHFVLDESIGKWCIRCHDDQSK